MSSSTALIPAEPKILPEFFDAANKLAVVTPEDYEAAAVYAQGVKLWLDNWKAYWASPKKKAYDLWKELCAKENYGSDLATAALKLANKKLQDWKSEQERIRLEKQRRLQAMAEEAARQRQEELLAEAAEIEDSLAQEQHLAAAEAVQAPVVYVSSVVPKVKGVSGRKVKREVVEDFIALACYCVKSGDFSLIQPNERAIHQRHMSLGAGALIPGVKLFEEEVVAVRGR